jgi:hypothetical protein
MRASVSPKKLEWALTLIGGLALQRRDAIRRKAAPARPSSSPGFLLQPRVAGNDSTRSLDGSETLDKSSRLLFIRTAGHGGCSHGRLTSDRDGDR